MNKKQYLEIINFLFKKENDYDVDLETLKLIGSLMQLEKEE
jgi:hypothetical protein